MGENKDLPSLLGWVVNTDLFEPVNLCLVNGDFVGSVNSITENGGTKTDQKSLVSDFADEMGGWLVVCAKEEFQVLFISGELIESLEIVVSCGVI